jgi:hypothetical protein
MVLYNLHFFLMTNLIVIMLLYFGKKILKAPDFKIAPFQVCESNLSNYQVSKYVKNDTFLLYFCNTLFHVSYISFFKKII